MHKIIDLIPSEQRLKESTVEELFTEEPLNPEAVRIVDGLFTLFYGSCRGFDKQFCDPTTGKPSKRLSIEKTQWYRVFTDESLTDMQKIKLGMKRFRIESPINVPTVGQFVQWCTPSMQDLGLLPKEQAYNKAYELLRGSPLDDLTEPMVMVLRHAVNATDRVFMRSNSIAVTQPVFYRNYDIAVRDYIQGKLKPIPKALEDNSTEQRDTIGTDYTGLGYEACMRIMKEKVGTVTRRR